MNTNEKYYDLMKNKILEDMKNIQKNNDNNKFTCEYEDRQNGFQLYVRYYTGERTYYRGILNLDIENRKILVKGEYITKYSDNSVDLEPLIRIESIKGKTEYKFYNTHILNLYDSDKREELKLTEKGFNEDTQVYEFTFPEIINNFHIESYISETIYDEFYSIYKMIRRTKAIKMGQYEIYAFLDFIQYMCRKFADVEHMLNTVYFKYRNELYVENKLSVNDYFIKMMKKYSKGKMGFYNIPDKLEKIKVLSRLGSEIDVNALQIINDDEAVELEDKKFKYALELYLSNGNLYIDMYEKEGDKPYTAFRNIGFIDIDINSNSPISINISTYLKMNDCKHLKSNFKGQKPYLKNCTTMTISDDEIDLQELIKAIELDKTIISTYNNTNENLYSYRITIFQKFIVEFLQYIIDNDLGNLRNFIYNNLNSYDIITTTVKLD